jgi:hypothetical protein
MGILSCRRFWLSQAPLAQTVLPLPASAMWRFRPVGWIGVGVGTSLRGNGMELGDLVSQLLALILGLLS